MTNFEKIKNVIIESSSDNEDFIEFIIEYLYNDEETAKNIIKKWLEMEAGNDKL